jgi:hypothetical protein
MIDRSYERRQYTTSRLIEGSAAAVTLALLAGALFVIVHFVVKFW